MSRDMNSPHSTDPGVAVAIPDTLDLRHVRGRLGRRPDVGLAVSAEFDEPVSLDGRIRDGCGAVLGLVMPVRVAKRAVRSCLHVAMLAGVSGEVEPTRCRLMRLATLLFDEARFRRRFARFCASMSAAHALRGIRV
jgi:hypothetical protein